MTMADAGDFASALEGVDLGIGTPVVEENPGQVAEPVVEAPKLSAFAQEYLNNVADEERDLATKHVQQWDKGFQKYAERISQKYAPYDQLGTFEEIRQAHSVAQMFANDPHAVANWLIEQGYGPQAPATPPAPGTAPADPFEGLPDIVKQKLQEVDTLKPQLQRYETALGAMYQRQQLEEQEKATAREFQALETGLAEAKKANPGLNEVLVLNLMRGGMELEQAVQAISGSVQAAVNQRAAPTAPRVLSASSLPPQSKNVNEMTDDERREGFIAMMNGVMK